MLGKIYRITGKFNPHIGMILADSLSGVVVYGYKKGSWLEIQKNVKNIKYHYFELESQKDFSHLKKMEKLNHFIIEDTDLLLPEYGSGNFDIFSKEISSLVEEGVNIYFNSTWKEKEFTEALIKHGLVVHSWQYEDMENEDVIDYTEEEFFTQSLIPNIEESDIVENIEQIIENVIEKKEDVTPNEIKIYVKNKEGKKNKKYKNLPYRTESIKAPEDLEYFYNQPKNISEKVKNYISNIIEKIINNF